ncbi:hypothetical protein BJY00DRAFT_297357 [Aspergillus carlsbadensis]|nr:hypothetical protein BJY00DRAFT_297357 [Aspergillus carlsbadensis]
MRYAKERSAAMMNYISFLTAAVVAVLPIGTLARECLTNNTILEGYSHYTPVMDLRDPSQLSELSDCSTLIGIIEVSPDFTGTIELNSVANFSGYITIDMTPTYGLEAILLPNVEYMEKINIVGAWGLKNLYIPKVQKLEDLSVTLGVEGGSFDLSALREVEYVSLAGYWPSISFPSLEKIANGMWISTNPMTRSTTTGTRLDEAPDDLVAMDIDLPVLKETAGLFLTGMIRSLSTPVLEILGHEQGYPRGLQLLGDYTPMEGVFLPALRELYGRFEINGSVSAVDLGLMQNTSTPIKIHAESPIELYSGLENAAEIVLSGPFAVINFTNLTTASDMNITTSTQVSCPKSLVDIYRYFSDPDEPPFCDTDSLAAAGENPYLDPEYTPSYPVTGYATATSTSTSGSGYSDGWGVTPTPWWETPTPTPTPVYSPSPTPGSGGGLSTAAEAAIATVAVVVGLVGIGGWVFVRRWNKRKQDARERAEARGGRSAAAAVAVTGTVGITTNRREEEAEEGLPRHSEDVAPPPYSREEPGKV